MTQNLTSVIPTSNSEFPMDSEGHVYHIGAKHGEVANRIILVGDPIRAELIAKTWLENPNKQLFFKTSNRGFTWYTGLYKEMAVTVMSIGMGMSMMDFAVREIRAIVDGTMLVIRLGSAGSPNPRCYPGTVVVSSAAIRCEQNLEAFDYKKEIASKNDFSKYYLFSKPVQASSELTKNLIQKIENLVPSKVGLQIGTTASAESFYGSQGRIDTNFDDHNQTVVDTMIEKDILAIEMETHQLFHLSNISKQPILAASCVFILMQRKLHEILDYKTKTLLETQLGEAILETLISVEI